MTQDTQWLDGVDITAAVRSGDLDPVEAVEQAAARIEAANSAINAVVAIDTDGASKAAREVDRSLPLAGIPYLVKDNQAAVGLPCGHGSVYRKGLMPTADHPMIARQRRAGALILGATNMPEAGLLATTEPLAYGPCNNPWDQTRTVGGSSGGAAAAVVAGMVPVAGGGDGGGSIRIPATACGAFGLKPSRGRTPGLGWGGLSVNHVLTRSVRDSALWLNTVSGPGPDAPQLLPVLRDFTSAAETDPPPLRIGVATTGREGVRYDPEVIEKVRATADLLANLGHQVEDAYIELSPALFADLAKRNEQLIAAATARAVDLWQEAVGKPIGDDDIEPLTRHFTEVGRSVTAFDVLAGYDVLGQTVEAVAPFFERYDVWLLPTAAEVAPPNGAWQFPKDNPTFGWIRMTMFIPPINTALANMIGHPAMSVPLHTSRTGLPIGMQFYGRYADEWTLLSLAGQLERALPWKNRHPQL